jgi:hypothetical protein
MVNPLIKLKDLSKIANILILAYRTLLQVIRMYDFLSLFAIDVNVLK